MKNVIILDGEKNQYFMVIDEKEKKESLFLPPRLIPNKYLTAYYFLQSGLSICYTGPEL